ncbi:hypothetical protein [Parafilimonas sp.]|uniref:hypothetical protein n=1 Tax=Parafilimonas sp. TaxID=1969739 RepID=UPI003F7EC40B
MGDGFAVIDNVFTTEEINSILQITSQAETSKPTFRKTADLFAVRQFLKEVSETKELMLALSWFPLRIAAALAMLMLALLFKKNNKLNHEQQ